VLPQIALHAANAIQGPAPDGGGGSGGALTMDEVYHLARAVQGETSISSQRVTFEVTL
jgi:hypothetical protein